MQALLATPPVSSPETFHSLDEDAYDNSRPVPMETEVRIDSDDYDWAVHVGLQHMRFNEGAAFVRLSDNVFVISVLGAQPIHHDRHLADLTDGNGFSEHTWNLVVEGTDDQMLLVENGDGVFEHFALTPGKFIYFNSMNRHLVSRKNASDQAVLVQVDGYGPDQEDEALAHIAAVLAERPRPAQVN